MYTCIQRFVETEYNNNLMCKGGEIFFRSKEEEQQVSKEF